MSGNYEKFVEWYLRFNGYFTVNNFVLHNVDRVFKNHVGNYSDADVLGIRMPYSKEEVGYVEIQNHELLVSGQNKRKDIVIGEVKSGRNNAPNKIWQATDTSPVEYILRFIGVHNIESEIKKISKKLLESYQYEDEKVRVRYLMFSSKPNHYCRKNNIQTISFEEIINFLVDVRGQSWIKNKLAEKSLHSQWDGLINDIFEIANNHNLSTDKKINKIANKLGDN